MKKENFSQINLEKKLDKKNISKFHLYWIESYLNHCRHEKNLGKQTLKAYERELMQFFRWKETEATNNTKIDLNTVEKYRTRQIIVRKLSLRSQAHTMSIVRNFFSFTQESCETSEKETIIEKNLAKRIVSPNYRANLPDPLSEKETMIFINFLKKKRRDYEKNPRKWLMSYRDEILILLLYILGLRISEALDLTIGCFKNNPSFLKIKGKGEKIRFTPLPKNLLLTIKKYIDNRGANLNEKTPLFVNCYGEKISRTACWKTIKKLALAAKINKEISPHTFRHSCATHMLRSGADIRMVQEFLGHSNVETTEIYTHVVSRDLELAVKKYHPLYN